MYKNTWYYIFGCELRKSDGGLDNNSSNYCLDLLDKIIRN